MANFNRKKLIMSHNAIIGVIFLMSSNSCFSWQIYEHELSPYVGFPGQRANRMSNYFFGNSPEGNMEAGPFIRAPFWAAY